jgi:hypothetical protein
MDVDIASIWAIVGSGIGVIGGWTLRILYDKERKKKLSELSRM